MNKATERSLYNVSRSKMTRGIDVYSLTVDHLGIRYGLPCRGCGPSDYVKRIFNDRSIDNRSSSMVDSSWPRNWFGDVWF